MSIKKILLIVCILKIIYVIAPVTAYSNETELTSGYITIVDETENVLLQTGLTVSPGDQYISEEDRLYEITLVEGTLGKAIYIRDEASIDIQNESIAAQAATKTTKPIIAIYHTHTDECYIPSDGKESKPGKGSIIDVGAVFANKLTELGYQTIHDKTLHDPHDANAYHRSRRTFMKLLAQEPATLFDIHRDSAPLDVYRTTINGQEAAKMLLVVGRQNQNQATTLSYAKKIKTAVDAKYKGLIRGIFIAHGNYNQDLNPRAMLVEIGTQYNKREAADRSAALFADVIPAIIKLNGPKAGAAAAVDENKPENISGQNQPSGQPVAPETNYFRDILYIIGIVTAGTLGYLYLSTGSWTEMKSRLKKFTKYEFTNFLGRIRRHRKDD